MTLTRIVRRTEPAPPDQIATTSRGPWAVTVLRIDADAPGRLQATHGPDLARVEPTAEVIRHAGALAGVNASFFTFSADPVNHPPVVPPGCLAPADPSSCPQPGDVVRFTPEFAASTPAGPGVEIVLDAGGCVVRSAPTRGVAVAGPGCVDSTDTGPAPTVSRSRCGPACSGSTAGRLVAGGEIVAPAGTGGIGGRNPRTIAGTTADGAVLLATIDGRQGGSVGTTSGRPRPGPARSG